MTPDQLFKKQKEKQYKEFIGDCDCSKWKKEKVQMIDPITEEVHEIEVCVVCNKEVK